MSRSIKLSISSAATIKMHELLASIVSRCSSGGIATGYALDGPGIESRWGRHFPHLSRPALGPTQPPVQRLPGLSRGKERPGRDADPSSPSSAVGHERVELYLYSPYGPYGLYRASVPVQGCILPFFTPLLNGMTWRYPVRNFTPIGPEVWDVRGKVCLRQEVGLSYDCH